MCLDADLVLRAYAECERMARTHYENFPVASWLLPAAMRPHVAAVYAFARTADDFADEGRRPPEERLRLLDDWERRLHACVTAGQRRSGGSNISRGWTNDSHVQPSGDALRGSAQRVSSGYHDASLPDVAPTCSITAADRPIRWAGSCCGSPATTIRRLDRAVRRAVHGASAHELLAGHRARLAEGPAVRAARRCRTVPCAPCAI